MEQKGLAMDLWEKRLEDYLAEYTLPYGAEHNLNRVFRVLKLSAAWPDFVKILENSREELMETEVPGPSGKRGPSVLPASLPGDAWPLWLYGADRTFAYEAHMKEAAALKDAAGIHPYSLQYLYSILLLEDAAVLWDKAGIPREIRHDSFEDFGYKLLECRKMYGIDGTFVDWFRRFYTVSRFKLGRLQFELVHASEYDELKEPVEINGTMITPDMTLINVHIPSCGHMPYESVADAYDKAVEFFDGLRLEGTDPQPPVFVCHSWLLWPDQEDFLPRKCNVLPFMRDYTIVDKWPDQGSNLWRAFYVKYTGNPAMLPRNGSFQRAWAEYLENGGECGAALGLMVWNKRA